MLIAILHGIYPNIVNPFSKQSARALDNPEIYGISKPDKSVASQLLKKDNFRDFIEWIQQKGTQIQPFGLTWYVSANEFDVKKQDFNMKYGQGSFEDIIGKLLEYQLLQMNFSSDRSRTGKREPKPAEYFFKLHPELIEWLGT